MGCSASTAATLNHLPVSESLDKLDKCVEAFAMYDNRNLPHCVRGALEDPSLATISVKEEFVTYAQGCFEGMECSRLAGKAFEDAGGNAPEAIETVAREYQRERSRVVEQIRDLECPGRAERRHAWSAFVKGKEALSELSEVSKRDLLAAATERQRQIRAAGDALSDAEKAATRKHSYCGDRSMRSMEELIQTAEVVDINFLIALGEAGGVVPRCQDVRTRSWFEPCLVHIQDHLPNHSSPSPAFT